MILSVLYLSFCAQKQTPASALILATPNIPDTFTKPSTPTDKAKKRVCLDGFDKGSLPDTTKLK
jgi:hypothetical protein